MKTGKILVCDGLFALVIIFGLNSCDQHYSSKKPASPSSQQIMTLSSLCNFGK
ncbi:MAG: hypothetical protein JNL11_00030 [Bdellovibrionaceae bacterium]|nr:hypothetical protein [Pseudobdellovibrionaceae bacterium]